jgi:serine/threonine protein kinase
VARAIRHPNVCRAFELGTDRGRRFITMELATGRSLREALPPRRSDERDARTATDPSAETAWASRLSDARAVCAGLAALHAVGVTHRDVTPQNVLRMGDGRLALAENDPTTAISYLERALAISANGNGWPHQVARARFALARALYQVRHDDPRARGVGRQARKEYPSFPGFDRQAARDRQMVGRESSQRTRPPFVELTAPTQRSDCFSRRRRVRGSISRTAQICDNYSKW